MTGLTVEAAEYACTRHGVISDPELASTGVSRHARERLVSVGMLIPLFRGVYRLASTPLTFEGECRAICLAAPDAGSSTTRCAPPE